MARYRTTRKSSRPTSSKQWIGAQASLNATVGIFSTPFWILPPNAVKLLDSPTVIYTRVAMEVYRSSGTILGAFGFGIIISSGDPDSDALPTVFSDPLNDWESDWIYRVVAPQAGEPAARVYQVGGADTVIESHAKRKIPYGDGILGVFEADSANTYAVVADVRCLLMNG
jgi:hypothetical protein